MNYKTAFRLTGRHWFTAYEQETDSRVWRPVYRSPTMKNLILTVGKQATLDRLAGLGGVSPFIFVGVGSDATVADVSQTQLNPSVPGSTLIQASLASYPQRSTTFLTNQSRFLLAAGNFTWAEAGIFNGTVNGTSLMYNRCVFPATFTKTSSFFVNYVIQFQQP